MSTPVEPEDDAGEPIEVLAHLEEPPSELFLGRIRGSIRRRQFAAQTVELSWTGVSVAVAEYLQLIFEVLAPGASGKENDDGPDPQ